MNKFVIEFFDPKTASRYSLPIKTMMSRYEVFEAHYDAWCSGDISFELGGRRFHRSNHTNRNGDYIEPSVFEVGDWFDKPY